VSNSEYIISVLLKNFVSILFEECYSSWGLSLTNIWSPIVLISKQTGSRKISTPHRYPWVLLASLLISLLCNTPRKLHLQVDSVRSFDMTGNDLSLLYGAGSSGNTVGASGIQNMWKEFESTCFHLLSASLLVWWLRKGHKPNLLPLF